MKSWFLILTIWFSIPQLLAQSPDMADMKKNIRILMKVIQSQFQDRDHHDDDRRAHLRPGDLRALYLKGQGILLSMELDLNSHFNNFEFSFDGDPFPQIPEAFEISEVPDVDWDDDHEVNVKEIEVREVIRAVAEDYREVLDEIEDSMNVDLDDDLATDRATRAKLRELRDKQRAMAREAREKVRTRHQELRGKKKILQEDREKIREEIKAYREQMRGEVETYRNKFQEIRTELVKNWDSNVAKVEDQLLDLICQYGAIRELPMEEHLTLYLKGADRSQNHSQGRVYVFSKKDLIACRNGEMTREQLKQKAQAYVF